MAFPGELNRSRELIQHPHVRDLLDPTWNPTPQRLVGGGLSQTQLMGTQAGAFGSLNPELLEWLRPRGLILDVGCGLDSHGGSAMGISTPVGHIPNAYGIDPILEYYPGNGLPERTIAGYAEDMPFRDKTFGVVLSTKGLGWYTDSSFDSYWAVREMIRVTQAEGLVSIAIGSGGGAGIERVPFEVNISRIQHVLTRIQNEDFGRERVGKIVDFSDAPAPQINIIVK